MYNKKIGYNNHNNHILLYREYLHDNILYYEERGCPVTES